MKYSQLKIAVVGIESPEAGGAYGAEKIMLEQIQKVCRDIEILVVHSKPIRFKFLKQLVRSSGFLSNILSIVKFNPSIWGIVHRFTWIPVSRFEYTLIKQDVNLVFFVGSYDQAVKLKKIPFVATIWDLGHRDLPSLPELSANREFEFREWRIRNLAIKAYAIVVDSELTREKLVRYYGIDIDRIIALPFCPQAPSYSSDISRDSFALYPAHFWRHKNHIVLFNAIAWLISQGKQSKKLKLTGIDRGNLNYLKARVSELGISDYVEFMGFVSEGELDQLYRKASVTLMPSWLGPSNLPPLESLLRNCPVAVNKNASIHILGWRGVVSLDGSDIEGWANVLDIEKKFEKVDNIQIQEFASNTRALNLQKLEVLFEEFTRVMNLFS